MTNRLTQVTAVVVGIGIVVLGIKLRQSYHLKQKLKRQQRELAALRQTINHHQKQAAKLNYNLVDKEPSQSELVAELNNLTEQLSLQLTALVPRANCRHDQAIERPVKIKVVGKYQAVVEFLTRLNQLNWIIELKTMQLTARQSKIAAEFDLSVYTVSEGGQ